MRDVFAPNPAPCAVGCTSPAKRLTTIEGLGEDALVE